MSSNNGLKTINPAFIYLPVLVCCVALCVFLHFKIERLNKKIIDLEVSKQQFALDSIDLILKKNGSALSSEEVQLLSEIVVRYYLGDLTYSDFKIEHVVENDDYIAAKAASILLQHPELILDKKARFEGKLYSVRGVIDSAYEKGKHLLQ